MTGIWIVILITLTFDILAGAVQVPLAQPARLNR